MNQAQDDESGERQEDRGKRQKSELIPPSSFILHPADDPTFDRQVQRLHQLTVYGRWLVVAILWISVGTLSLWGLRYPISLWLENFTWTAVRYGLFYNFVPTLGLSFCIGMTVAVLIWQSRNILLGMPDHERRRLEQQVHRIRQQGSSHPLWKWVCQSS